MKLCERLLAAAALFMFLAPAALHAEPAPVTPAEHYACESVAQFLGRGPEALFERMSSDSFVKGLSRADALAEIEARTGPRELAWWRLSAIDGTIAKSGAAFSVIFPSGVDDVIFFDLVPEKDSWRIRSIRTFSELPPALRTANGRTVAPPPVQPALTASRPGAGVPFALVILGVLAPVAAILGALSRKTRPRLAFTGLAIALVLLILQVVYVKKGVATPAFIARVADPQKGWGEYARMRTLVPYRTAIALGRDLPPIGNLGVEQQEIATLWRSSLEIGQRSPDEILKTLGELRTISDVPMAKLLRARTYLDRHRGGPSLFAEASWPQFWHDTFWVEMFRASGQKPAYLDPLVDRGTRDAAPFYLLAAHELVKGDAIKARGLFQQAWKLEPLRREDLASNLIYAVLLRDASLAAMVNLYSADEAAVVSDRLSTNPIALPPSAHAVTTGELLRILAGNALLEIPGGAALAPLHTEGISPELWQRTQEEGILRSVPQLLASKRSFSRAAQARAEEAADALASHNRWSDIVELTNSITPESLDVSPALLLYRVEGLIRIGRNDDAKRLASGSLVAATKENSATLMNLAELITQTGSFDTAIDLYSKAAIASGGSEVKERVKQLELRRELAASSQQLQTAHFDIRATPDVPATVSERVGDLLEAELQRLTRKIPIEGEFGKVRVNILNWEDFRYGVTGSDYILGLFDGDITIPFAEVGRFREDIVSILTHELTHAVLARVSGGNAPHWLQEGTARRMELLDRHENAFQKRKPLPAIDVLDPILTSFMDADQVADAYTQASTLVFFLEERFGPDVVSRLSTAFRRGANTEEAFVQATGKHTVEVDREFREWGKTHAETFVDRTPWPYAKFYSLGIDPEVRQGIHFSKERRQ